MAPNVPALLEAHFGVPMAGAVLNALNYPARRARRSPSSSSTARPRCCSTDTRIRRASARPGAARIRQPCRSIDIADPRGPGRRAAGRDRIRGISWREGDPDFAGLAPPMTNGSAIALNYTSGTTGNPKGVVYHHRGAYLNALGNAITFGLRPAFGLSLDPADVPLQRLDLYLGA